LIELATYIAALLEEDLSEDEWESLTNIAQTFGSLPKKLKED
jgi:hypothetical protein